ncbi:MAG: hypothetical protein V7L23_33380 [Nostoc sp.]|uniref:hypothetical protein n=1 Tax=Nostoc sp. TaxID=1180 RepID=UPI002FF3E163
MAKYKDLYRAAELTADYEKLVAYQALSRSAKQALYKQHVKSSPRMNLKRAQGYIRIFGSSTGLVVIQKRVPSSVSQPSSETDAEPLVTTLLGLVNTSAARVLTAEPTDTGINILSDIKKFKFAKLSLISVTGQNPSATGRVLSNTYNKLITETVSTPFGRSTVSETYAAAVASIKGNTAYATFLATSVAGVLASNRIVLYPESQTA